MVAGVLAHNMANDFFFRDAALLFWAPAGMSFGYALRHESPSQEDQADRRHVRRRAPITGTSPGDLEGRRAG
jgi:hypothetical protein